MSTLTAVLTVLLATAIIALLVPITVFFLECLIAVVSRWQPGSQETAETREAGRVAVIIPAHNEEAGLAKTLECVLSQLEQSDRIVVVADNCTDRTADIARGYKVDVVERTCSEHRGKGFALDAGVKSLAGDPPDVAVIVDADCILRPGAIAALANQARRTDRPAQAVYLMEPPPFPTTGDRLSAFAFQVKNLVRPLALSKAGLPCLLTGTGMAFPWAQIGGVSLASGNIVEDMQLGLDLVLAAHPPRLCPGAVVTSSLPAQARAAKQQRRRWEHGHLGTIRRQMPRLLLAMIRRPRVATLAIALELSVPPLSMLVGLLSVLTSITVLLLTVANVWLPAALCTFAWALLLGALMPTWLRYGRRIVPPRSLVGIPAYVLRKVGLYWSAFWRPEQKWVRTDRGSAVLPDPARRSTARVVRKVQIGHACIDNVTMDEAVDAIEKLIHRRTPSFVVTPNVDHVVRLEDDAAFHAVYNEAQLVLADGMPLLWSARLFRTPLKEKVSGSDLFPRLCHRAGENGYRLFFLGGRPGAAEASAEKFRRLYPGLQIATDCPPFGFERDDSENGRIVQKIRNFTPDVLFVGLGSPKQELWMHRHSRDCQVPVSAGVGASFEFESGHVRRAPRIFQRSGLEWLWRLLAEPRRMYRRYLIEDPRFLAIVWRQIRAPQAGLPAESARAAVPQD